MALTALLILHLMAVATATTGDDAHWHHDDDLYYAGSSSTYAVAVLLIIILLVCVVWAVSWWPPIDEAPKPQILVRIVSGKDGQPQVMQGPDGHYYLKTAD